MSEDTASPQTPTLFCNPVSYYPSKTKVLTERVSHTSIPTVKSIHLMLATGSNQMLNRSVNHPNGNSSDSRRGGRRKYPSRTALGNQNPSQGKNTPTLLNSGGKNVPDANGQLNNHPNNHLPKARATNQKPFDKGNRRQKNQGPASFSAAQTSTFSSAPKNVKFGDSTLPAYSTNVVSETGQLFDDPSSLGFMKNNQKRKARAIPRYMLSQPRLLVTPPFHQDSWDQQNQAKMMQIEAANNGSDYQGIYEEFQKMREVERKKMEELGLVDAENTRKDLNDAIYFQGTCLEMCPVFERTRRALENNVKALERDPITNKISRERAVKAFSRPAAGQPPPMPSDVRPPHILMKTLDYIVDNFLDQLPDAHSFIWDRTRSIRQDFIYQNFYGAEAIDCNERIVRIHLVSLHVMAGSDVEYSQQQELEQFNKALQTLTEIYEDVRNNGGQSPNEAEFRAYHLISHFRDPELERELQRLPDRILRDHHVQLALRFRYLMTQKHLVERGYTNIIGPMDLFVEFFRLVSSEETSFLLACLLETHFNEIRFYALKSMSRSYHTKGKPMIATSLQLMLGFDTIDQLIGFISYYEVDTINDNGTILIDLFNKEKLESKYKLNSLNDKPKLSQAFSNKLNVKMGRPLKEFVNSGKPNDLNLQSQVHTKILRANTRMPSQNKASTGSSTSRLNQGNHETNVNQASDMAFGAQIDGSQPSSFGQPFGQSSGFGQQSGQPFGQSSSFGQQPARPTSLGHPPQQQSGFGQSLGFGQTSSQKSAFGVIPNYGPSFDQISGGNQISTGGQLPGFGQGTPQMSHNSVGANSSDSKTNSGNPDNLPDFMKNQNVASSEGFGSFKSNLNQGFSNDRPAENDAKITEQTGFSKTGSIPKSNMDVLSEFKRPAEPTTGPSKLFQGQDKPEIITTSLLSDSKTKLFSPQSTKPPTVALTTISLVQEKPGISENTIALKSKNVTAQKTAFNNTTLNKATELIYDQLLKTVIDQELNRLLPRLIKYQNRAKERSQIIEAFTSELYSAFVSELTHQSTLTILADEFAKRSAEKKVFLHWKKSLQKIQETKKAKSLKLQELDAMEFRKPTLKRANAIVDGSQLKTKRHRSSTPQNTSFEYIHEKQKDIYKLWEPLNLAEFVEACGDNKHTDLTNGKTSVKCLLIVEDWSCPFSKWLNTKFSLGLSDDRTYYVKRVETEKIRVSFESLAKTPRLQDSSINNTAFVIFECGMVSPEKNQYRSTEEKLVRDSKTLQKIVEICNRYCLYKVQFLILFWDGSNSNLPIARVEEILRVNETNEAGGSVEKMRVLDMSRRDKNVAETLAVGVAQMGQQFNAALTTRGIRRKSRAEALKHREKMPTEKVAAQPEVSQIVSESVQLKEAEVLRKGRDLQKRKYLTKHLVTGHSDHIDLSNTSAAFKTPNTSFANNSIVNLNNSFFGHNSTLQARDQSFLGSFVNGSILEESTPFASPGPKFARPSLPKKVQELKDLSAVIRARYKK